MGKMVVIFAGYSDDMREFISKNAGLERRMSYYINFEDYSNEELWDILKLKVYAIGLQLNDSLKNLAINYFSSLPRSKNFANAGAADRLLSVLKSNLDNRIVQLENPTPECLTTIQVSDFPNYNYSIENDASNQPKNNNESVKIRIINSHKLIDDIGELSKSIGLILLDNGSYGEGSCFLVSSDGIIFTCEHCVPENKKISIILDNQQYDDIEILYKNKELDIAILKIKGVADLPYLNINSSFKGLKMGDKIGLLAFPKGREMGAKVTYTDGIISKKEGIHYHHTANATHGSSGGAFFDLETKTVYGILNGGFGHEGANINVAVDIIQLYKQNNIEIEFI
jgi:S1-C subfamily serine protease